MCKVQAMLVCLEVSLGHALHVIVFGKAQPLSVMLEVIYFVSIMI